MVCRDEEDVMVDSADELSGEPVRSYHGLSTLAKAQLLRQRRSLPEPVSKPQETQETTTRSGKRPMQRAPPVKRKRREASKVSMSDIEARPCGIRWVRWIFDTDPISDATPKKQECSKEDSFQQVFRVEKEHPPNEGTQSGGFGEEAWGGEIGGGFSENGNREGGGREVEIGEDPPYEVEECCAVSSSKGEGEVEVEVGGSWGGGGAPVYMCLNMIFDCNEDAFEMAVGDGRKDLSISPDGEEEEEEGEGVWGPYEYRKLSALWKENKKEIEKRKMRRFSVAIQEAGRRI